jgi:hypothetical protein
MDFNSGNWNIYQHGCETEKQIVKLLYTYTIASPNNIVVNKIYMCSKFEVRGDNADIGGYLKRGTTN